MKLTENTGRNELARQIAFTIVLVTLFRLGISIPLPFINLAAFEGFFRESWMKTLSVFALGLMPYTTAYLLVEIGALLIPNLKRLRHNGYSGRCRLKQHALALTLLIAGLQAYGICQSLDFTCGPNGAPLLNSHNPYEKWMLILTLMGGAFLLIYITELISRYGIGNGISIMLLAGICSEFGHDIERLLNHFYGIGIKLYVISLLTLVLVLSPTVFLLKAERRGKVIHTAIEHPTSFLRSISLLRGP